MTGLVEGVSGINSRVWLTVLLVALVCRGGMAQDAQPWEQPGTEVGQEIVGPDGGTMVWVPSGSFPMGSTDEQVAELLRPWSGDARERLGFMFGAETPQRRVALDGYWVAKHTVTNAQYRAFCEATGREFPEKSDQGDDHPVVWVSWEDAKAYCDHYGLSLPTEAQWEYVARGPEGRVYPWGNEWDRERLCWAENRGPGGETSAVGSLPAGASWVGALDMAGNVLEWCADWYDPNYYNTGPSSNPSGPAEAVSFRIPVLGVVLRARVLRGGSGAYSNPDYFRCANRDHLDPTYRYGLNGFRCARTMP